MYLSIIDPKKCFVLPKYKISLTEYLRKGGFLLYYYEEGYIIQRSASKNRETVYFPFMHDKLRTQILPDW